MSSKFKKTKRDAETRAMIQAGTIIDRLTAYVNGEVELSASQVSAAKTLLNKVLPDLSSQKDSGENDGSQTQTQTIQVVEKVERIIVRPENHSSRKS